MPGTSDIVPAELFRAVVGEPRDGYDVLAELVDAGRAVNTDGTNYKLDVVMQPASDDPTGYSTLVMWHAKYAARADITIQPRAWRLSTVYNLATQPLESPTIAVNWFRDNETRLFQMLDGAVQYRLYGAACELAEPMWSLARYCGSNFTALLTQFVTIRLHPDVEDEKREHRHATALARAARCLSTKGMHKEAIDYANMAVRRATSLGDLQVLSTAQSSHGRAHEDAGNLKTALEHYEASLATAEQIEDPHGIALRHRRIGVLRAKLDDPDSAIAHLRTAERLMSGIGDTVGRARVLTYLAQILLDDGQTTKAHATIKPVLEVLKTTGNDFYIAEAAAVAAAAAEHTNPAIARGHYILARAKFDAYGLSDRAADMHRQLDRDVDESAPQPSR
ncbi:tetratricopeptide repeat protein [Lentzea terrae]|uniref:tetratricopeptide repeat protein n=1 Tax=Lentzea terrae TaxID=2200761 RepID=UPI0013006BE6|nr:tetratricopeptide repeat protein [Lentzea terrae]